MSSVRRTIQVLDLLARKGPLGVRAVAEQLALPVGSVHRLLSELDEESAVERDGQGAWQLGYRLLDIVELQLDGLGFQRLARPFCEAIAAEVGETVNVNVTSGDGCVCIDKVRGNENMQLDWRVGSRGPLHCGGAAKAILAFLADADQQRIVNGPLKQFTPNTITSATVLRAELARIRERGYSIDAQEVVLGVFCVAVPIVDRTGRPVGAISISGPSPKAAGSSVQPLASRLGAAAEEISRRLGFSGEWPPLVAVSRGVHAVG
ncbi:IclR family transcriptional regulator [Devosia rhodophyticola]|uniref:IclR family transcriptional regulator n=1 Tax=Devosia rhodophyticola TaxID=3026423 RepID=A0ABY7Z1H5_9HYPH|nr:IclR family transcriptional regulator [Devosia rhodophyticola]WDR06855.1 IclR family transcriptional regulator [Devosia rhodophyticola]